VNQIVISVHGDHLSDSAFMRPSPNSRLVELFPEGKFSPDRGFVARSLRLQYIAWLGKKSYSSISDSEHPPISPPTGKEDIELDIAAIVQSIQDALENVDS